MFFRSSQKDADVHSFTKGERLFTEGVVIAVVTVWSYFIAFNYQAAYLAHFQIPSSFVEINTIVLLHTIVALLGTLMMLLFVLNALAVFGVFEAWKNTSLLRSKLSAYVLVFFFLVLSPMLIFGVDAPDKWLSSLGFFVVVGVASFGWTALVYRGKGNFDEKLLQELRDESRPMERQLLYNLFNLAGREFMLVVLVGWWVLRVAGWAGESAAIKQKEFFVIPEEPVQVVISIQSTHVLSMPLNASGTYLIPEIRISSFDDLSNAKTKLIPKELGKLTVQEMAEE